MLKISMRCKLLTGVAGLAACLGSMPMAAQADEVLDNVLRRLEKLEKENAKLKAQVNNQASHKSEAPAKSSPPPVAASAYQAPPLASDDGWYLHKKDGPALTFQTPGGEITAYGQFDVSVDATSKGIENKVKNIANAGGAGTPIQNTNGGWLAQIASNISYVGIRGFQKIPDSDFKLVYQLETLIDVAVNSGVSASNSNQSDVVKGGLTTRDSFIGLSDSKLGSLKVGKVEAPYKKSTDIFNPFNGMLGDYRVIMGNTGGDNRVEFATRMEHSIWWESPDWSGLKLAALFSPGQNRANNSDNLASGTSDCAGGNNPYSGGFTNCADGAFSDAFSLSATYSQPTFLITTAYERHQKVNRASDLLGIYGNSLTSNATASGTIDPAQAPVGAALLAKDVADEDAFKVGALYRLPTKTTIGGIFESMHRYVSSDLQFQNERQRNGTWFFLTQELGAKDVVDFGWGHAFHTPGDPGQHTSATLLTPDGLGAYAPNKNSADMLTADWKHKFSPALTWYINGAITMNESSAHYDLGAGGHGSTTDCHDAFSGGPSAIYGPGSNTGGGGVGGAPQCWTGATLLGVSTGINYKF